MAIAAQKEGMTDVDGSVRDMNKIKLEVSPSSRYINTAAVQQQHCRRQHDERTERTKERYTSYGCLFVVVSKLMRVEVVAGRSGVTQRMAGYQRMWWLPSVEAEGFEKKEVST
eukprot:scaffold334_cov191-Alexandrium_tamarense.AAC.1